MAFGQAANPVVDFIQGLTNGVQHSMQSGQGGDSSGGGGGAGQQPAQMPPNTYTQAGKLKDVGYEAENSPAGLARQKENSANNAFTTPVQDVLVRGGPNDPRYGKHALPGEGGGHPYGMTELNTTESPYAPGEKSGKGSYGSFGSPSKAKGKKGGGDSAGGGSDSSGGDSAGGGSDSSGGEEPPQEQGTAGQAAQGVTQAALHKGNIGHALGFMLHQASTGGFGPGQQPQTPPNVQQQAPTMNSPYQDPSFTTKMGATP